MFHIPVYQIRLGILLAVGTIGVLARPAFAGSEQVQDPALPTRASSTATNESDIMRAVEAGTSERLRPTAMTAVAIMAGLVPIMWGSGTGSEVMHRIAAPMVGGMLTTTVLCLLVLPVIYGLVLSFQERKRCR